MLTRFGHEAEVCHTSRPIAAMSNCRDLWIGVSCGLSLASGFVGSFDESAVLELRAGSDEGDEVGCVHGAPAGLGGLDEFERHRDAGGA